MAISLTDFQLSTLDSIATPIEAGSDRSLTDGGSTIRCDVEGMSKELAGVPQEDKPAQTWESLRAYQTRTTAVGPK